MTPVTAPAHGPSTHGPSTHAQGRSSASLRRTVLGVLLALAAALGVSLTTVAPAEATITRLCYGFSDCQDKGYGNAGYRQNIGTMWWRMYSGHNCTNYAAYRMVKSGMSTTRPWEGSGNASNWGYAMDHITDQTPTVGAVAWWKAYAPGAGSSGHVAIVEEVISADKIIVSQDSWGGDFSWAVITRSGSGWPSGFVHFNDAAMTMVAEPAVSGEARIGATLSTDGGRWNPQDPTLTYQWRVGRKAVVGATSPTYTVRQVDEGKRVKVKVTATKDGYPTTKAISAPTAQVTPGAITTSAAPTVTGTPQVDRALTATTGGWNMQPDQVRYQWLAGGNPIAGATATTFTPGPGHVGSRLRVRVTATKTGYTALTTTSAATEPVAAGQLASTTAPSISGPPAVDRPLTAAPGTWNAQPDQVRYQWLAAGAPIPGATSATFTPRPEHLEQRLSVQVTGVRAGYGDAVVTSARTAPVALGTLAPVRAPTLTGTARPGQVLTLDPGAVTPETAPTIQWLRDGVPVPGATTTTYAVTADDLGAALSATVTRSREGYGPQTATTPATATVLSPSALSSWGRSPAARTVRVLGTVTAPDVAPVSGTVIVKKGRRVLDTAELIDGRIDVTVSGLRSGERRLKVIHPGSDVTTRSSTRLLVTVR